MAASRIIEQETGTYTGFRHQHNGYYAGDFSQSSRSGTERRVSYTAVPHQAPSRQGLRTDGERWSCAC